MEEHPDGAGYDKEQGQTDNELLGWWHTGNIFVIVGIAQHHLLAKGEVIGINNGFLLGRCGVRRHLCRRYLRGALGIPGLRRIGTLLLGTQGLKLGALLACTLFLLAAGLLGTQGLKLGAFIIA